MNFTFTKSEIIIKYPTTRIHPGDVCRLVQSTGETAEFIVVNVPEDDSPCSAKCDLKTDKYSPNTCAYYDFKCIGHMAFKSLDKALEDL